MKHVLLIAAVLVSFVCIAQKTMTVTTNPPTVERAPGDTTRKDTVKTIPLPAQRPQTTEKAYFLVLPESSWTLLMQTLRRSTEPSNKIDDMVNYILQNVKELKPPSNDNQKKHE